MSETNRDDEGNQATLASSLLDALRVWAPEASDDDLERLVRDGQGRGTLVGVSTVVQRLVRGEPRSSDQIAAKQKILEFESQDEPTRKAVSDAAIAMLRRR